MPCVTACAMMSCPHNAMCACMQASHPMIMWHARKYLLPFLPTKQYLLKLTTSHFSTLNTKIANQNVLKILLIAMYNKNKADYNENFRICAQESIGPLYFGRLH